MSVILCPACDLAHRPATPPVGGRTQCLRCKAPLQRPEDAAIETAIALAVCALVLILLSNAYPLVAMHVNGVTRETTLIGAARGLYDQGDDALAALVLLTTVIVPFLQIATVLYILIPLWRGRRARGQTLVFRIFTHLRPWSFMEVFLLGALAALVRLSKFTQVVPGIALWSCVLLMLALSGLNTLTSPEQFWRWVERRRE